ncbi:hypothetical protein [Tissierella praeacuta]|uniref:hypothetical protein n=1 Tax=Tissierella praeacuta TaxID=43131 RepID=UPI003341F234
MVLDYDSENYVVLHGYFGLFVYDLKANKIVGVLDLKPINCEIVAGDNASSVSFNESEMTIRIWLLDQNDIMFEYNLIGDNLRRILYDENLTKSRQLNGKIIEGSDVGSLVYDSGSRKYRIFDTYFTDGYTVKKGLYENKKDIPDYGSIELDENGQYLANLGYLYGYAPKGDYIQEGDQLICYDGDKVIMKFRIKGDTLIYEGGLKHFDIGEEFYLKR